MAYVLTQLSLTSGNVVPTEIATYIDDMVLDEYKLEHKQKLTPTLNKINGWRTIFEFGQYYEDDGEYDDDNPTNIFMTNMERYSNRFEDELCELRGECIYKHNNVFKTAMMDDDIFVMNPRVEMIRGGYFDAYYDNEYENCLESYSPRLVFTNKEKDLETAMEWRNLDVRYWLF